MTKTLIHRFTGNTAGMPVNAYIVEGPNDLALVDTTLTVSDGQALRKRIDDLNKPLRGVAITHTHPDHYGALVEVIRGLDVPVFATAGVDDCIRRDDPIKEQILRPMFGDEWAPERSFPTKIVKSGQVVPFGEINLTVSDIGPGESPHDSIWWLTDEPTTAFVGDVVYDQHHAYLADGFFADWLATIDRLRTELPAGATLHPGHGEPRGLEVLDAQAAYIRTVVDAVENADWTDPEKAKAWAIEQVHAFLPTDGLQFLMELSIDPLAQKLGKISS